MAKYRDTVETLITARNEVAGELQRAEQQMKQQAARERQRQAENDRIAKQRHQSAVQRLEQLGKIATVTGAAVAGISALNVSAQILSGDMDAAAAAAERIPFGIGEAVRSSRELYQTLSGARQEQAKIERIAEAMARADKDREQTAANARQREMAHAEALFAIQRDIALLRAAPEDRDAMQARLRDYSDVKAIEQEIANLRAESAQLANEQNNDQRQADLERIEAIRRELNLQRGEDQSGMRRTFRPDAEGLREELAALREVERARVEAVEAPARQAERLERNVERARVRNQERERERRRQEAEDEKRRQNERQQAAAAAAQEITQTRLRQTGQTLKAELHAIRTATDARVQAAEEANNAELAQHERTLGEMREREARAQAHRRQELAEQGEQREASMQREKELSDQIARARSRANAAAAPQADQERFLTGVREQTQQQDRAMQATMQKQVKAMEDQLAEARSATRELQEQTRILRESPIIRAEVSAGGGL